MNRPDTVRLSVDGREVTAVRGQTLAAALIAAGVPAWRRTRRSGAPRGVYCGIGVCFDCLLTVNGQPGIRACLALARDSDAVTTEEGTGQDELTV